MSACARSIQAGTMFASPASTTSRTSNGSMSSWSELIEPDVYCACADRPRPEPRPRSMAHGVIEWCADDGHIRLACRELGRIGDPRQLHEAGRADVGRQVEIAVRLVLTVPAIGGREGHRGRGGARPRRSSRRRTRSRHGPRGGRSVSFGAPPVRDPGVQRGAPARWYTRLRRLPDTRTPAQASAWPAISPPGTPSRPPRRAPGL